MTRLLAETVEVHRRDDDPDQFLWRGRLYVVRAVLARWTEAGQWWRNPAVTALSSGEGEGAARLDDGERDWWRVEADSGMATARQGGSSGTAALSAGTGVYDLCFDWATSSWCLARVLD